MRVKNNKVSSDIWVGMTIEPNAEYDIEVVEIFKWQGNDKVIADLSSGDLLIGDGVTYKSGANAAINFLLGADVSPRDPTGRMIVRSAITIDGFSAQFHSFGFKTSSIGSIYNKDSAGNDLGFTTLKLYDVDGVEITDPLNEGDAVKTVIDWMPSFDYEIVGGQLFQSGPPAGDVYLWLIGLPGILNVGFTDGGLNLKLAGDGGVADFDGRASKFLPYNGGAGTNKLRLILKHAAGLQHEAQLLLELFKA